MMVSSSSTDMLEGSAFLAKSTNVKNEQKKFKHPRGYCVYCKREGHIKDQCFKLIKYLDWFKRSKDKEFTRTPTAQVNNVIEGNLESPLNSNGVNQEELDNLATAILKILKTVNPSYSLNTLAIDTFLVISNPRDIVILWFHR